MGHPRVEEATEPLDETKDLDPALVGSDDGAVNGGVQGRCVAVGGQDADPFHGRGRTLLASTTEADADLEHA